MSAGIVLAAAALLVWPAARPLYRLRALPPHADAAAATVRGGPARVSRLLGAVPTSLLVSATAGLLGLFALGPLHGGAAAILAATLADLRSRARRRRDDLTRLGAWERALDDASSALRAGAGPGVALRRAAEAAASVEGSGTVPGPGRRGSRSDTGTDRAGRVSGILAVAAAHADLGGDVAGALRAAAPPRVGEPETGAGTGRAAVTTRRPTSDDGVHRIAGELAGAWLLATRHGVVLADVVDGLSADVASRRERAVRVDSGLAGPRATAVILTALPAFGVLLGSGFGADPLGVLVGGPLGGSLCLAGAVFLSAGLMWTDRIVGGALR